VTTDPARSPSPLLQLTLLRIREYTREPESLFWVFAFPVLMALALGIAFRSPSNPPVRVGVTPLPALAPVRASLERLGGFDVREVEPGRVDAALRDGVVHLVIVDWTPPAYRYDPTRAEGRLARLAVDDALQRASGRGDRWTPTDQRVVTPGSRYIDWLVPGLLGMTIMSTSLWGIGFSVVTTRTRKLLKRLVATPMRRRDYLLSQILGRLVFLAFEAGVLVVFAWFAFDVQVRGAIALVAGLCLLGALSSAGLALLVACRAKTVEAVSGLLNVVMLPMWILSGVFFSTANFPEAMQTLIKALPLTALNDALRAVMLEGATAGALALDLGILTAWMIVSSGLALRWFRWL
jgi:ABC-type polysaccharide/polyol phosphate export permease